MIEDSENVARAIFSPAMVKNGRLLTAAFKLRPTINEDYISVMLMSINTWLSDIYKIPQNERRKLFGFAQMNVGDIKGLNVGEDCDVKFDVIECTTPNIKSHAGIFTFIDGQLLVGGKQIKLNKAGIQEDFLLLAIRRTLVELAQEGLAIL